MFERRRLRAFAREHLHPAAGCLTTAAGGVEQLLHDVLRRRRPAAKKPYQKEIACSRQAGLGHAGHVGHQRRALAAGHGQREQAAAGFCADFTCGSTEAASRTKAGCRPRAAPAPTGAPPLKGTCTMSTPAIAHEQHAREVRRRAVAGRAEVELAGILLRVGDQLLQRGDRRRRHARHDQRETRSPRLTGARSRRGSKPGLGLMIGLTRMLEGLAIRKV